MVGSRDPRIVDPAGSSEISLRPKGLHRSAQRTIDVRYHLAYVARLHHLSLGREHCGSETQNRYRRARTTKSDPGHRRPRFHRPGARRDPRGSGVGDTFQKYYTPTITPTCRGANSTRPNLALKLTNNMPPGGQGFGSAQITIPSGWVVPALTTLNTSFSFANPATARDWTGTKLNATTIQLVSSSSADLVPPGGSITFTFPATAPASGSSTWTTAVKQSNNFLGTGNDFTLKSGTPQPVVTIGICSAPPVSNNDAYNATEDTQLSVAAPGVLSNDTDPENDALTAVIGTGPSHGTLSLSANGSFTYTGASNYNGTDTFTYKANDGSSNSTNAATVTITIAPVNDAPTAVADSYSTTRGPRRSRSRRRPVCSSTTRTPRAPRSRRSR